MHDFYSISKRKSRLGFRTIVSLSITRMVLNYFTDFTKHLIKEYEHNYVYLQIKHAFLLSYCGQFIQLKITIILNSEQPTSVTEL